MPELGGRGRAKQAEAPRQVDGPLFADDPPDALGQLLAAGLRHADLAFWMRTVHQIHGNPSSRSRLNHLCRFAGWYKISGRSS